MCNICKSINYVEIYMYWNYIVVKIYKGIYYNKDLLLYIYLLVYVLFSYFKIL